MDAVEIQMVAQLQQYIEQKRMQQFSPPPQQPVADVPAPEQPPEPVTAAEAPPVPSDIEVASAITKFAQDRGIDKAKALLEEFGAKRVMDVPPERRAELLAKVRA